MRRHLLLVVVVVLVGTALPALAAPAEQLTLEERAKLTLRLRLLDIEVSQLMKTYEKELTSEYQLKRAVKSQSRDGDGRPPALAALQDTQEAVKLLREKLLELETERIRLSDRLGRKNAVEPAMRADLTLEKILDVLLRMEKRLEALERRPPPRR